MVDPEIERIRERKIAELKHQLEQDANTPEAPIEIGADRIDEVVAEHGTVLVDLWAPWCAPCRQLAPILDDLAQRRAGDLVVAKVNVDENPEVPQRFSVRGIPTMLLFHGGEMVDRIVGALPAAQIEARIDQHAG